MNIKYIGKDKELAHCIAFSGGRSSGMLMFELLPQLDASRGDCIVFNNTSAEHPATYDFVWECKRRVEAAGIPFFVLEFQTYEKQKKDGIWYRSATYRLVNEATYKSKGEVFEELISWKGYLPNRFSGRICTAFMKVEISEKFIKDYLNNKDILEEQGHSANSKMDLEALWEQYRGNIQTKEGFIKNKEYVSGCPTNRAQQNIQDFTAVAISQLAVNNDTHLKIMGIRADEPHRVNRIKNDVAQDAGGYIAYLPLADWGITKYEVLEYWRQKEFDLDLPAHGLFSNCVYCFMKSKNKLVDIIASDMPRAEKDTPADVNWWINIEKKYGRQIPDTEINNPIYKGRNQWGFAGFEFTYEELKDLASKKDPAKQMKLEYSEEQMDCYCFD